MDIQEQEIIIKEMTSLEHLMTVACNFEVHMFWTSCGKYQCRPADLCNAFCSWYCEHGLDTFRNSPKEACLYLTQKFREFVHLDKTERDSYCYRDNPILPEPVVPMWSLN